MALWDSPRQRDAYEWFTVELANLRTAFRWAADHDDLDTATSIATYAAFLGLWVELYEPTAWAEELIEPARPSTIPGWRQLYVMAAQCYAAGRVEDAVGYAEAAWPLVEGGHFDQVPFGFESWLSGAYVTSGDTTRWIEWCRAVIARDGAHIRSRASLAIAWRCRVHLTRLWRCQKTCLPPRQQPTIPTRSLSRSSRSASFSATPIPLPRISPREA